MKNKELNESLEIKGTVAEMGLGDILKVPFSHKVNKAELIEDDNDPMFITVEVMNPQISKNRRRWTEETMRDIANQINEKTPDGFLGHLDDKDRGTKYPTPQTIWVGAKLETIDGKLRLLAKGYVMPYATNLRTYLKKATKAGKKVAVSVYGQALQKWNSFDKVYDIASFDLESIDWARTGGQGIVGDIAPVIAREQDEGNMDKKLSEITLEDLKEHRSDLVDALKTELESATPPAPEPKKPEEVHEMADLLSVIGTDSGEQAKTIVSEMQTENKALLEAYIDSKVSSRISKTALRPLFRKMVVSEMTEFRMGSVDEAIKKVEESDEGKAFIAEMVSPKTIVNPQDDNHNPVNPVESNANANRKYTKVK